MEKPGLWAGFKLFSANVNVLEMRRLFVRGGRCRDMKTSRTEFRSPCARDDQIPTVGGTQSRSSRNGVDGDADVTEVRWTLAIAYSRIGHQRDFLLDALMYR